MPGNSAFVMVAERGWQRGMGTLLGNEFARWWKTRMWWIQCLIWGGIVGFLLGSVILQAPEMPLEERLMIYSIFGGLFPAVAVVIIMQDVLVGEKQEGTAAWVLSKPVSRSAFILSKFIAHSLGVLATMVAFPGMVAFGLLTFAAGASLELPRFLAANGVLFLTLLYYLSLTLMLGTFFHGRGPVIGISLALVFGQQYLMGLIPFLKYVLPWTLVVPLTPGEAAVVPSILTGQAPWSWIPVAVVALQVAVFVSIAVVRFMREEF